MPEFFPAGSFQTFDVARLPSVYLQMVCIIWARYFFIAGLFMFLLWGRREDNVNAIRLAKKKPSSQSFKKEITMSVVSSAIYALPGALVYLSWEAGGTAIYTEISGLWGLLYLPLSAFLYLFLHDTYFYWSHRAMHHPLLYRTTHLTHHKSGQPTAWGAFSFHPWETIASAWLLPLLVFFIPLHGGLLLSLLVVMTYCSVANHAGWEVIPRSWLQSPIGRQIITASHHNLHHTNYRANYGLYFRFWDKVCGTDIGLAEPARSSKAIVVKPELVMSQETPVEKAKPAEAA